jgi:type I restriction-modification system DNA methylase subunit
MSPRASDSEVHAYAYILDELTKKKGWSKEQIFVQQECHNIKPIKEALGATKPENVVKVDERTYYIIESKNEREKIDQALKEARVDYAEKINRQGVVKATFITGIAGNSKDGFISKSQYFLNGNWESIQENGIDVTGLLSKSQIESILETNNPKIQEVEINDAEFVKAAEEINGILHEGGINLSNRAKVISALLLAIAEGSEINISEDPIILVDSINSRVDVMLKKHNKTEFARYIKLDLPSSSDNHIKYKQAIVLTIQELLGLNIRSAMRSGKDVLGKFYEVFLKYGNGAKEIGIVLTPRHITKFAAEVLDIQPNDLVLDPTCGTGGFLVAAFDEVKRKASEKEFEDFKWYGLYGIERDDTVVSLALVNMIFRGDGKNNIIEGDCFSKWLATSATNGVSCAKFLNDNSPGRVAPITKVLMNPPFPKKKTDRKEYLFIEQALKQMQNEGILFSVIPYSCMIKGGGYLQWRKRLLNENTLLAVVTFPEDLFYPIGVHTLGVFIKKGIPHPVSSKVLWIRALNDGRWKKKGKRLEHPKAKDDYPKITPILQKIMKNQKSTVESIPAFQKLCLIDKEDSDLELIPEAYLDELPISQNEMDEKIDDAIRDSLAFLVRFEHKVGRIK